MEEKVLVTGGSGFIGSHIVEKLAKRPKTTVVVYDIQAKTSHAQNVVYQNGDILNLRELIRVIRDEEISSIVHMIGRASVPDCRSDPGKSFSLNVMSVQVVLETMRRSDVKGLIFPSTAAVYGQTNGPQINEGALTKPTTVYGYHKLAAESLIKGYAEEYNLDTTILRLFNVYGDLEKEQGVLSIFVKNALARKPLIVKGGKQLRDFVHVDDVVKCFVKALDIDTDFNEPINVGSGVGVSIEEIAEMVHQSFPDVKIELEEAGAKEYSICANTSRLKNLLGCEMTPPKEGIPRFIESCKSNSMNREIKSSRVVAR
jgi:UDP-glucose 4-epimerase